MFEAATGRLTLGDTVTRLEMRRLEIGEGRSEVEVTLRTQNLVASHTVHDLKGVIEFTQLWDLLTGLAQDWRGFAGERQWTSIDRDFRVVCRHDGRAHVQMAVDLTDHVEGWKLEGLVVELDLGSLDKVADDVRQFQGSLGPD